MPKLCSAITGLLDSSSHNNTVSAAHRKLFKLTKTQWSASLRVAIDDATCSQYPTLMPSDRAI